MAESWQHHPFASRPIPAGNLESSSARLRASFADNDPRGAEPLEDLEVHGMAGTSWYAKADGTNPPYGQKIAGAIDRLLLRTGAGQRLRVARQSLHAYGLDFFIYDAYRPLATQQGLFDFFLERQRHADPHADEATLRERAARYAARPDLFDPNQPASAPLHLTGGAVDLTLCDQAGRLLPMGAAFDEDTERSATAYYEGVASAESQIQQARRILYWVMRQAEFTNYAAEYWHYDYGNSLWAIQQSPPVPAFYGPTAPPA